MILSLLEEASLGLGSLSFPVEERRSALPRLPSNSHGSRLLSRQAHPTRGTSLFLKKVFLRWYERGCFALRTYRFALYFLGRPASKKTRKRSIVPIHTF